MEPSLTQQGGRRGQNLTSLILSGAELDCLPCMLQLHDSGISWAQLITCSFSYCPTIFSLPHSAVCNRELKWRISVIGAILQKEKTDKSEGTDSETFLDLDFCNIYPLHRALRTLFVYLQLHKRGQALHNVLPRSGTNTRADHCQTLSGLKFLP